MSNTASIAALLFELLPSVIEKTVEARLKALEQDRPKDGTQITDVHVDDTGELVMTIDGEIRNLGCAVGRDGTSGTVITDVHVTAEGELVMTVDGEERNLGQVAGQNGYPGTRITDVEITDQGELAMSIDGTHTVIGVVRGLGRDGADGKDGKNGRKGKDGVSVDRLWYDDNQAQLCAAYSDGRQSEIGKLEIPRGEIGVGVFDMRLTADNRLIAEMTDGGEIDCGQLRMPAAPPRIERAELTDENELRLELSDGSMISAGRMKPPRGIEKIWAYDGKFRVRYTDGAEEEVEGS